MINASSSGTKKGRPRVRSGIRERKFLKDPSFSESTDLPISSMERVSLPLIESSGTWVRHYPKDSRIKNPPCGDNTVGLEYLNIFKHQLIINEIIC